MKHALMADCISGVYEVDGFIDDDSGNYTDEEKAEYFYNQLKNLPQDTVIAAWVSEEMFEQIDNEYGIDKLNNTVLKLNDTMIEILIKEEK